MTLSSAHGDGVRRQLFHDCQALALDINQTAVGHKAFLSHGMMLPEAQSGPHGAYAQRHLAVGVKTMDSRGTLTVSPTCYQFLLLPSFLHW